MLTSEADAKMPHRWSHSVSAATSFLITRGLLLIVALLLLSVALFIHPAAAQAICGDHAEIIERLSRLYQEKHQAVGLSNDGRLIEILVSSSGSWTILITDIDHMSCLVAAGESWERIAAAIEDLGA